MTRRILEECATVAEAEKLVRSVDRTTTTLLTVCDPNEGAVFEVTTKNVEVRRSENSVCLATNHFRTEALCVGKECPRYDRLVKCQAGTAKLGVDDVLGQLKGVAQGKYTIETMIFEPKDLRLHLAFGRGPASGKPLQKLDLKWLFEKGFGQ
jgi:hypothetical protein